VGVVGVVRGKQSEGEKKTIEKAAAVAAAAKKKLTTGNEGGVLACLLAVNYYYPLACLTIVPALVLLLMRCFAQSKGQPRNPLQH